MSADASRAIPLERPYHSQTTLQGRTHVGEMVHKHGFQLTLQIVRQDTNESHGLKQVFRLLIGHARIKHLWKIVQERVDEQRAKVLRIEHLHRVTQCSVADRVMISDRCMWGKVLFSILIEAVRPTPLKRIGLAASSKIKNSTYSNPLAPPRARRGKKTQLFSSQFESPDP